MVTTTRLRAKAAAAAAAANGTGKSGSRNGGTTTQQHLLQEEEDEDGGSSANPLLDNHKKKHSSSSASKKKKNGKARSLLIADDGTNNASPLLLLPPEKKQQQQPMEEEDAATIGGVLTSAPPPWHTVLVLGAMIGVFGCTLPSTLHRLDEIATVETFTTPLWRQQLHRHHPAIHIADSTNEEDIRTLACIRATIATVIWFVMFHTVFGSGWEIVPPYLPKSKLKRGIRIKVRGLKTLSPFTCWYVLSFFYW
jgi:hypothetical protein